MKFLLMTYFFQVLMQLYKSFYPYHVMGTLKIKLEYKYISNFIVLIQDNRIKYYS